MEHLPKYIYGERRQEAIQRVHQYINEVSAMGANDEEIPKAQRFLSELTDPNQSITEDRLKKIFAELGNAEDKSSNYH